VRHFVLLRFDHVKEKAAMSRLPCRLLSLLILSLLLRPAILPPLDAAPGESPKPHPEVQPLLNKANEAYQTSKFDEALRLYSDALEKARALKDRVSEASALNDTGIVYAQLGQPHKALEFFRQALPLYREVGSKRGEASALNNIGKVYDDTGQPKALEFYGQALPLYREVQDKGNEANALLHIGKVYGKLGQPHKALEFYGQALPLYREVQDKRGQASALNGFGFVYDDIGQPHKALEFFRQALPLSREAQSKEGEASALKNIATLEERQGRLDAAERHLRQAMAILETTRESLGGLSEAKISFLGFKADAYHRYLHLLLRRNKPADAFAIAQKTKARALLDLMHDGRVDIRKRITEAERQQEQELRRKADRLNAQMVKEGVQNEAGAKKRFAALKQQLAQAESALQTFTDSLYARYPDLARKRAARTVTLAEVAQFLPADTALLEYVVLKTVGGGKDTIDKAVLFCITVDKNKPTVAAYHIAVPGEELTERADDFRDACADRTLKPYQGKARDLYALLVAPAAKQLAGKKRLVLCPDGPLWEVPFQALLSKSGQFLLEQYEIAYAYSATGAQAALLARAEKQRTNPTGTLLALANPDFGDETRFDDTTAAADVPPTEAPLRPIDRPSRPLQAPTRNLLVPRGGRLVPLPGTQEEADLLKQGFKDAAIYTQEQAQEALAKREAGKYRYVHLASHAFFNDAAPLLSSVVLAQPPQGSPEDGFLTAREIFELNLSADLVVLSACNTARGERKSGEGVVGLTWALFVAGAPTQVLSQWAVEDASTARLMQRFYAGLAPGQAGKGAALRAAALSLGKERRHAHPYYWAPFVLVGDWRK
jgi:CHAT domain-containing protein/Flp pilus assembly protein TadD